MGARTLGQAVLIEFARRRDGEGGRAWVPLKTDLKLKFLGLGGCWKAFGGI